MREIKRLWEDYVFHKQTVRELMDTYGKSKRTIRFLLDQYVLPQKHHRPREVHLVVDATYYGERTEDTSWGVIVARDPHAKEDLLWHYIETETTYEYRLVRDELEHLGYIILSVTGDGFSGIRSAFSGIPFQMCHVHMERIVTRGTTKNPQTEAGQVLRALICTIHTTNKKTFSKRFTKYLEKYRDFLNEKTTNPLSGETYWTHKELRKAAMSLTTHMPFLFTFIQNKNIPRNTNSLEGHFSHIDDIVGLHRGLSQQQKQKFISTILLASTIAPTRKTLDQIL